MHTCAFIIPIVWAAFCAVAKSRRRLSTWWPVETGWPGRTRVCPGRPPQSEATGVDVADHTRSAGVSPAVPSESGVRTLSPPRIPLALNRFRTEQMAPLGATPGAAALRGGEPLALPIAFRLYRKGGPTLLDLVEEMVNDVAAWVPDRTFTLTADGSPRSQVEAGRDPRTRQEANASRPHPSGSLVSRSAGPIRAPRHLARSKRQGEGRLLLHHRPRHAPGDRDLRIRQPLAHRRHLPQHQKHGHASTPLVSPPWYTQKSTPSFQDAIAALRKALWRERFFQTVGRGAQMDKFQDLLVNALARAA